jgi:hypothetical protein
LTCLEGMGLVWPWAGNYTLVVLVQWYQENNMDSIDTVYRYFSIPKSRKLIMTVYLFLPRFQLRHEKRFTVQIKEKALFWNFYDCAIYLLLVLFSCCAW